MIWLIPIGIIALIIWAVYGAIFGIGQSVHKEMTLDNCTNWDYGTYDQFIEQMNAHHWSRNEGHPESFFSASYSVNLSDYRKNYVHASIVVFDGKGMVLKGRHFVKYRLFLRRNRYIVKPVDRRVSGLWSVNK